jgi:hypothetical protein
MIYISSCPCDSDHISYIMKSSKIADIIQYNCSSAVHYSALLFGANVLNSKLHIKGMGPTGSFWFTVKGHQARLQHCK